MKSSISEMLGVIASNFQVASNLVNNARISPLSKSILEIDIEKAIVLAEAALEVLKDNRDNIFK